MKLHYIQHVPFENPGSILTWAADHGHTVTATHVYADPHFPELEDLDWLIIMGGPMNIDEETEYPWLIAEKELIRAAVARGKVVIGLCLGGQLIAGALGGKVTRNPLKEIGWLPVRLLETARKMPLFDFFPEYPMVFQWHGDTFSTLPEGAVLLATSEACPNQAFLYGDRVFGFQYHLENTEGIIRGLIKNCGDELVPADTVQPAEELLAHPEYIAQDQLWMEQFLSRLMTLQQRGEL